MKKIFTLSLFVLIVIVSKSQAVLNEVYPQPGNSYHEFFELYNENNSLEYLDNYTLVTFYEEAGGKTGFYVLDLPDDSIIAHGYYAGASQTPFNIQGQLGLTANSNWNMPGTNGVLTKWESNGSFYTSVAVPANLNDLFVKIVGPGGVFHIFVYKNGVIVNGLVAGINTTVIPAYIKSMPDLPVNMSGSSPDFTIDFSSIPDNSIKYLSNSAGTNNGYYRSSDGLCGEWLKSDMPGQHNPRQTNGVSSGNLDQITIASVISQYEADTSKSLLTYNATSGSAGAFPIVVEVYADYGIAGELDVNDMLIDSRIIDNTSTGSQFVLLPASNVSVIIVVKSASGCNNRTLAIGNYDAILPVHLLNFYGNINRNNKITLQWKVANNEIADQFEVQRSYDGYEFKTIGIVFASEKTGTEDYMFYETVSNFDKVFYRLKMIDNGPTANYSKTIVFQSKFQSVYAIQIIGNPVSDKLSFSYSASASQLVDVKLYDMNGRVMLNNKINSLEGYNMVSLPLSSAFKHGMYVVEVNNGNERQTSKFLKQ